MIKLTPNAPGCKIVGYLYHSDDLSLLGEDMAEVALPNGVLVSAGWYPEGDPQGAYRILATSGLQCLRDAETKNVHEALARVEAFARELADSGEPVEFREGEHTAN